MNAHIALFRGINVGGKHVLPMKALVALLESERRRVREIDEALMRIKNKSYGICVQSGKPIARERLEAKPWAKYTIEIARELEKRGMM